MTDNKSGPQAANRTKRVAMNLAAIGLGILLALLIGELALRLIDTQWRAEVLGQAGVVKRTLLPDPELGYRPADESYFKHHHLKHYLPGKQEKVFRVFGLGDSFVNRRADMGVGDPIFYEVLEKELERRLAAKERVEVFHFGLSGYAQIQHLELLRRHLPVYHPDLVIMQVYIGNDLAENAGLIQRRLVGSRVIPTDATGSLTGNPALRQMSLSERLWRTKSRVAEWLDLHSFIYRRINQWRDALRTKQGARQRYQAKGLETATPTPVALERGEAGGFGNLHMFDLMSPAREEAMAPLWGKTEVLIGQMAALCRQERCHFLVVLLPQQVQVIDGLLDSALRQYNLTRSDFTPELPSQHFSHLLARQGIAYLDLLPIYRQAWKGGVNPYEPGGHIGREGHRLTGNAIINRLNELRWLPSL